MVCNQNSTLNGDLGFIGTDAQGIVKIGYEVISAYRQQYAFEAIHALVIALSQPVKKIIAHCPENHIASMRILQKIGMQRKELVDNILPNAQVFKWELAIQSKYVDH